MFLVSLTIERFKRFGDDNKRTAKLVLWYFATRFTCFFICVKVFFLLTLMCQMVVMSNELFFFFFFFCVCVCLSSFQSVHLKNNLNHSAMSRKNCWNFSQDLSFLSNASLSSWQIIIRKMETTNTQSLE